MHNIVVSIHAIATFQALHDYLRPRVSGLLSTSSRLSGMLAALQAGVAGLSDSGLPLPSGLADAANAAASSSSGATVTRRRSQRLSAKSATNASDTAAGSSDAPPPSLSGAASHTATQSSTSGEPLDHQETPSSILGSVASDALLDPDLQANFSEDDVDAELFEDDADPDNSIADEKTVTLSVAEGTSVVYLCYLASWTIDIGFQMAPKLSLRLLRGPVLQRPASRKPQPVEDPYPAELRMLLL